MSLSLDQQYALMLASYVKNFKRRKSLFNFSCPICGDSQKNKTKARGYLFPSKDRLAYKCHNCGTPINSLGGLLKFVDNNLFELYLKDRFLEDKESLPASSQPIENPFAPRTTRVHPALLKISNLPQTHFAKQYVEERKIPHDRHFLICFIDKWKGFCNEIAPGTFKEIRFEEPRLVFPIFNSQGVVQGYQGRSFDPNSQLKYQTVLLDPSFSKIYGRERIDESKTIIAVEGPIDSLFINNAIASCGGTIDLKNTVVVYDNEPRNPHTVSKVLKAIKAGFEVCIWPEYISSKDLNDMAKQSGYSRLQLTEIIHENSFSGLRAALEFARWKRI